MPGFPGPLAKVFLKSQSPAFSIFGCGGNSAQVCVCVVRTLHPALLQVWNETTLTCPLLPWAHFTSWVGSTIKGRRGQGHEAGVAGCPARVTPGMYSRPQHLLGFLSLPQSLPFSFSLPVTCWMQPGIPSWAWGSERSFPVRSRHWILGLGECFCCCCLLCTLHSLKPMVHSSGGGGMGLRVA